jgi:hypothetical protein
VTISCINWYMLLLNYPTIDIWLYLLVKSLILQHYWGVTIVQCYIWVLIICYMEPILRTQQLNDGFVTTIVRTIWLCMDYIRYSTWLFCKDNEKQCNGWLKYVLQKNWIARGITRDSHSPLLCQSSCSFLML